MFYLYHCSVVCNNITNMVLFWSVLWDSTVVWKDLAWSDCDIGPFNTGSHPQSVNSMAPEMWKKLSRCVSFKILLRTDHFLWNWSLMSSALRSPLMISLHWFRIFWCSQVQAITWAHVDSDLYCHMVSLGHNELTHDSLNKMAGIYRGQFQLHFLERKNCYSNHNFLDICP